jgi:hypothetical protein
MPKLTSPTVPEAAGIEHARHDKAVEKETHDHHNAVEKETHEYHKSEIILNGRRVDLGFLSEKERAKTNEARIAIAQAAKDVAKWNASIRAGQVQMNNSMAGERLLATLTTSHGKAAANADKLSTPPVYKDADGKDRPETAQEKHAREDAAAVFRDEAKNLSTQIDELKSQHQGAETSKNGGGSGLSSGAKQHLRNVLGVDEFKRKFHRIPTRAEVKAGLKANKLRYDLNAVMSAISE